MPCNTSLQPQNPNLSLSEKKKKVFFSGNSHSKNRSRGESPFGLFLSNRYLLNGLIKKKTKIKKPPETFYGVAFLILKMAQIRSQRKKKCFDIFLVGQNFTKKWGSSCLDVYPAHSTPFFVCKPILPYITRMRNL